MRILTTILFLILLELPSWGISTRLSHDDSIESNLKLDSIVTIYLSDFQWFKVKSEYNKGGKKIRELFHNRSSCEWEKSEFIYDTNNRLIEKYQMFYDGCIKTVYKYNVHGNKIAEYHNWKKSYSKYGKHKSKWKDKWKYSYDTNGNITEIINYDGKNKCKHVYVYDTKGNLLKEIKYSSHWLSKCFRKKEEIYYNIQGKKEKLLYYIWNSDKKDNDIANSYTYIYDEYFNIIQTKELRFNNGEVSCGSKSVFIYDNNGNKKEELSYLWKSKTKDWSEHNKTTYSYDDNGNLFEETKYSIWSKKDNMNSYPISEKTTYVYNEKGEMTAKSKIIYRNDYETKEWLPLGREEYTQKVYVAIENYYDFDEKTQEWFTIPYRTDTYYLSKEK
jgi:hypothetical protein